MSLTKIKPIYTKQAERLIKQFKYSGLDKLSICKEFLRRVPSPWQLKDLSFLDNSFIIDAVTTLKREGVVKLPGFIPVDQLKKTSADFDCMLHQLEQLEQYETRLTPPRPYFGRRPYLVDGIDKKADCIVSNDPFRFSAEFLSHALDQKILSIIAKYFNRSFFLQHIEAKRLPPREPGNFSVFNWHHDAKGRKINVMFLLTDVPETGQCMTYLQQSHHRYYGIKGAVDCFYNENDIMELEKQNPDWSRFQCSGKAGTVFLFDANGIHRGNRSQHSIRDTLLVKYSPNKSHIWELNAPEEFVKTLTKWQQNFLKSGSKVTIKPL